MKDFDFDELDRAVSSVLTKKQAENASVPTGDQSQSAVNDQGAAPQPQNDAVAQPTTDDQSVSTDASSSVDENMTQQNDDQQLTGGAESANDGQIDAEAVAEPEPELSNIPVDDQSHAADDRDHEAELAAQLQIAAHEEEKLLESHTDNEPAHDDEPVDESAEPKHDTIPQKRGRFMDMVHPSADMGAAHQALGARTGITLKPSADFAATPVAMPTYEATEPAMDAPSVADEEQPVEVDAVDDSTQAVDGAPASHEDAQTDVEPSTSEESAEPMPVNENAPTPFIPDVPVEKRPLNAYGNETAPADEETPEMSNHAEQPSAALPKEFNPEIMAVEANESVSEIPATDEASPEAPQSTPDASPSVAQPAASSAPTGIVFQQDKDKTTEAHAEHDAAGTHPVFDPGSYDQPLQAAAPHGTSKMMWVLIIAALFLVGAALGVLYFLYGQR